MAATTLNYVPAQERSGIALCLSGGGYRAALFHLGAVRRLDELGILSQVTTIASVSGGSILAAHLADRLQPWPGGGRSSRDWEVSVAARFRALTARNIRTWPILRRLLPWNWLRTSTGVETLAGIYQSRLTGLMLEQLPERPRFILCATDMSYGVNWVFERSRMGDYQVGYVKPPPSWPLGRAVAASSCFPPIFNPLPIRGDVGAFKSGKAPPGPERDKCLSNLRLTDGGNYDNLGLEPVWKDHAVLFVSDGGATFDVESDKNLIWRLSRYMAIQGNQALALRKRWLIASFISNQLKGTYWGVGSSTASYGDPPSPGYSEPLVKKRIAEIRTDMDAFSEAEAKVLENHGYLVCEAAIRTHASEWSVIQAPLVTPHAEWMDEDRVTAALANSHRRRLPLGRW